MSFYNKLMRFRYDYLPVHLIGEILTKRWIDNLIPFLVLIAVVATFGAIIPDFYTTGSLVDTTRQLGEFGIVVIAMMIVMVSGGIDLSVASTFALVNMCALGLTSLAGWPIGPVFIMSLVIGALVGLVNGILIGYLRLRAFLTTLVTLVIVRAIVDLLYLHYATDIAGKFPDSPVWNFLGEGTLLQIPSSFWVLMIVGVGVHLVISRMKPGWRIMAIGGARRSAYNVGISVKRDICLTYVAAGILVGLAGFLYATRLSSVGADTGVGLELMVLTAAVVGGNSLGGGRGSAAKAVMGALTVLLLTNGLIRLGLKSGGTQVFLGIMLLFAVIVDIRFVKNRFKILTKVYVSPTYLPLPQAPSTEAGSTSPYALNDRLRDVEVIGLGKIDGPEDILLDNNDDIYTGNRIGDIIRFKAPDYKEPEVFAHCGGRPLGLAFDKNGNILVCIGGMGLYSIDKNRKISKLTDETNRTPWSIIDDSRLSLADDLDVAPDGRVFFSEATKRYEMHEWPVDSLEGRGNGRILCYDPSNKKTKTLIRNLVFANGVCVAHDNNSFFFAETWGCRVSRYWLNGPKAGKVESILPDIPGYPDNINRASDGNYWLALVGMRTPAYDLAMAIPGFRKRMSRRVASDEWMFPNINIGCVIKFNDRGEVLEAFWDFGGVNHPMVTSMREHRGYLYLGGINNNRIGRIRLQGADTSWTGKLSYWGDRS
ncbi:MAG TPA: SMP-30/gluconolactonase/LRE family protein [Dehalococcoidales bacterium]|nr:SMP-30/gluconolactonase/LRE family protein [Dehalococcoidales bacterium]